MEISGKVVIETFAKGSKSEHQAVYVEMGTVKIRLRKKGGNPFHDESLHAFAGKMINATGKLIGKNSDLFEVEEIREI